jgi:hypothetical protein
MSPFIQQCLSRNVLKSLLKGGNMGLDYNKAFGGVTAFYRSAIGTSSSEVQIPLPQEEKPRTKPDELTDVEIEQAIVPLFDYFDANLQTLNTYLSDTAKEMVMTRVWKEILTVIEGLLIPPLSDVTSDMKPLTDKEVDIAFKWLRASFLLRACRMPGGNLKSLSSSCEIISTLGGRVPYRWRCCKTKSTATLSPFAYIMIGIRESDPVLRQFDITDRNPLLMQRCADGRVRPHDAAIPPQLDHDEETCQERIPATEPGYHKRAEEGEEAGEGERGHQWRDDHENTEDEVRICASSSFA